MTLHVGVVALGVRNVDRAAQFWCEALGYDRREDGFGGWSMVLVPRSGSGTKLALQRSETTPEEYPRIHLDLHVASVSEKYFSWTDTYGIDVPHGEDPILIIASAVVIDLCCHDRKK